MARSVLAPDGQEWKVGREWLPRRIRLPRHDFQPDLADAGFWFLDDFSAGGILFAIALGIVIVIAGFFVWPLIAIAIEIVVLVVLFLAGLAGRVFLRRPWRVIARSDVRRLAWEVPGWRETGEAIETVTAALAAGQARPRVEGREPVQLPHG